jgi:hypothetical protein
VARDTPQLPKLSHGTIWSDVFIFCTSKYQLLLIHTTMFSLRSFARSAPRSISRLASQTTRQRVARSSVGVFQQRTQPSAARAAFSTASSTQQNEELVAKLESEYSIEKDMRDEDSYNQTIREYIDNSPFDVQFPHHRSWDP